MGGSSKVTVGYRYYMGLLFGLCYGPVDALKRILVGDREAWSGDQTQSGSIFIDAASLFGGDDREGGVRGPAAVMMGEETQAVNEYLRSQLGVSGASIPAFRGVMSVLLNGPDSGSNIIGYTTRGVNRFQVRIPNGLITANNPYVKPWAFQVKRIAKGWNGAGQTATTVTEYANSVLYGWDSTLSPAQPLNCLNDHEFKWYRIISPSFGQTNEGGSYSHTSLASAYSQLLGLVVDLYDEDVQLFGPLVSSYRSNGTRDRIFPGAALDFLEFEEVEMMYFTVESEVEVPYLPDSVATIEELADMLESGVATLVLAAYADGSLPPAVDDMATARGQVNIYLKSVSASLPAYYTASFYVASRGVYLHFAARQSIAVRRKVRAPDSPCFPRCDEPYPLDPNNPDFCLIGDSSVSSAPYASVSGTFKALSLYSVDESSFNGLVTRYPLGPVLPSTDPSYNSQAYWDAAYAAAVTAGSMPAGLTYSATGTGGVGTYPRTTSSVYSRTYTTSAIGGDCWNVGKAEIDGDMNPAHIVYQCVTDPVWGMGYPESQVDQDNFAQAADTLYDEGFGLSLLWNQQTTVEEFIGLVMDHIGGVFYANPATGLFSIKLIRDDYSRSDLPEFGPENVVALESFQRVGYGDTTNEVTVVYRDRETNKDMPITVQDLANVQAQGSVVSQTRQYPGISKASLAARVAMRDLVSASTPLAKARIRVNREAWSLIPGDVLSFTWPKLGLSGVVFRVLSIDTGSLTDGAITVEMAEDVFGLPDSAYSEQEPGAWTEPDGEAAPITLQDVLEAPYWTIARTFDAGDLALVDADAAYFRTLATRSSPGWTSYRLWSRVGSEEYVDQQAQSFAPSAVIVGALTKTSTELTLSGAVDFTQVLPGTLAQIGSGESAELVEVTEVSQFYGTVTIARAVLDTTPAEHPDGARIWFMEDVLGIDPTERATGETVDFKLTAIASGGEGDLEDASVLQITAAQRFQRPYPPGNFLISGESYPEQVRGDSTVTWAHRDRTQQTAYLVHQDEASIGPEAGTTYAIQITDLDTSDVLVLAKDIDGTSYEVPVSGGYQMRLELWSETSGQLPTTVAEAPEAITSDVQLLVANPTQLFTSDGGTVSLRATDDFVSTSGVPIDGGEITGLAESDDYIFVTARDQPSVDVGRVCRIDKATLALIENEGFTSANPRGVAYAGGKVWVSTNDLNLPTYSRGVHRFNPDTLALEASIDTGAVGMRMLVTDGLYIWSWGADGNIYRFNTATNTNDQVIPTGYTPFGLDSRELAYLHGALWVRTSTSRLLKISTAGITELDLPVDGTGDLGNWWGGNVCSNGTYLVAMSVISGTWRLLLIDPADGSRVFTSDALETFGSGTGQYLLMDAVGFAYGRAFVRGEKFTGSPDARMYLVDKLRSWQIHSHEFEYFNRVIVDEDGGDDALITEDDAYIVLE